MGVGGLWAEKTKHPKQLQYLVEVTESYLWKDNNLCKQKQLCDWESDITVTNITNETSNTNKHLLILCKKFFVLKVGVLTSSCLLK